MIIDPDIAHDPCFQVRFAALQTLTAVSDKLKEDYATLLPEAIPFLAELMEGKNYTHFTSWFTYIDTRHIEIHTLKWVILEVDLKERLVKCTRYFFTDFIHGLSKSSHQNVRIMFIESHIDT